jgi:hypothetical protein
LFAFVLESFHRVTNEDVVRAPGSTSSAIFLVVVVLILSFPFVHALLTTIAQRPQQVSGFSRATGIVDSTPKFRETSDLVRDLNVRPQARPLFSIAGDQMVYVLAGRVSPLEKYEYILYLVQGGLIRDEDARSLVPESTIIDRLAALDSIVIDYDKSPLSTSFRKIYPGVVQHLETHYRLAATFGGYRLWEPLDSSGERRPIS